MALPKFWKVEKCCDYVPLRIGSIVIGIINIVVTIIVLIFNSAIPTLEECTAMKEITKKKEELQDFGEFTEIGICKIIIARYIASIVAASLGLVSSIMMIYGSIQEKSGYLLQWLIYNGITAILFILYVIYRMNENWTDPKHVISVGIFGLCFSFLYQHCLSVVLNFYLEVSEKNSSIGIIQDEDGSVIQGFEKN